MSGPLASWVGQHYKPMRKVGDTERPDPIAVAVVKEYALAADHDGRPTYLLTPAAIVERTGFSERAVYAGRRTATGDGVLEETKHGGGKGIASRFRVSFTLCPDGDCSVCRELAARQPGNRSVRPDHSLHQAQGKAAGRRAQTLHQAQGKRPYPAPGAANPARGANRTETEVPPTTGGEVLPRGVDDRAGRPPMGAGAQAEGTTEPTPERERGWREARGVPVPAAARPELNRIKAQGRQAKVDQALGGQPVQSPAPPDPAPPDPKAAKREAAKERRRQQRAAKEAAEDPGASDRIKAERAALSGQAAELLAAALEAAG